MPACEYLLCQHEPSRLCTLRFCDSRRHSGSLSLIDESANENVTVLAGDDQAAISQRPADDDIDTSIVWASRQAKDRLARPHGIGSYVLRHELRPPHVFRLLTVTLT